MLHGRMLRYLDEVARCGSIRKAADRLNVAASAVTGRSCRSRPSSTRRSSSACLAACG